MTATEEAPGPSPLKHAQSLLAAEIDARRGLVAPRKPHGAPKVSKDQSIGPQLTEKLLRGLLDQQLDENPPPSLPLTFQTTGHDHELEEDEPDVDVDLERPDAEVRELFEMFQTSAPAVGEQVAKALAKTKHAADPQVCALYRDLATILKRYRSGPMPQAVRVLASQKVKGWFSLLELTKPSEWSMNALCEITQLFALHASDKKVLMFLELVLMEIVRETLQNKRKVPRQLFQALAAAARRPKAFIFGVLADLSANPSVAGKEAKVISAIIGRVRLPREHVNAFMIQLAQGEPTATRLLFMGRFLAKGTALAMQTIDALVGYFGRYSSFEGSLPLFWFQAMLAFVKRNASALTLDQREWLKAAFLKHAAPGGATGASKICHEMLKIFEAVPPFQE